MANGGGPHIRRTQLDLGLSSVRTGPVWLNPVPLPRSSMMLSRAIAARAVWARLAVAVSVTALSLSVAAARDYPTGTVRFITQLPAGSGTDPAMRIVIDELSKRWGQQAILVNQPGAGGAIAARTVATATPDGSTLFMAIASTFFVLPELQPNLPFNVNDFVPIGFVGEVPLAIAVTPTFPADTLPALIAASKQTPGGWEILRYPCVAG